jgi:citrate synthase
MSEIARIEVGGKVYECPVIEGSEGEKGIDIIKLRAESGYITLDEGFGNTGSCRSDITFIDGSAGILRYRGIPIEELAEKSTFVETAFLVIYGHLPTMDELTAFSQALTEEAPLHEGLRKNFDGFSTNGHPMAILSSMINAMSTYHPDLLTVEGEDEFNLAAARLLSKVRTIAAAAYRTSKGLPINYPKKSSNYAKNFLELMFSNPHEQHVPTDEAVQALNLFLLLHADHEQNCSTSTVRMVASSGANIFTACSAGVCALWGPLHGGANMAVLEMLNDIQQNGVSVNDYVNRVKDKKSGAKLMGFGHRVYKNFDPRAKILQDAAKKLLDQMHVQDPKLEIAQELADIALHDDYFIERNLYPNVDFYSGLILSALEIPLDMFTVMFSIGRMPGWIANWKEVHDNVQGRISRPRQIYTGPQLNHYVDREKR